MSASRRFRRKRGRIGMAAARKQWFKEQRRLELEHEERSREHARVAAEFEATLDNDAAVRDAYTAGFVFAWLRYFADVPGVLELTA